MTLLITIHLIAYCLIFAVAFIPIYIIYVMIETIKTNRKKGEQK